MSPVLVNGSICGDCEGADPFRSLIEGRGASVSVPPRRRVALLSEQHGEARADHSKGDNLVG
jgi:hypothetical protein